MAKRENSKSKNADLRFAHEVRNELLMSLSCWKRLKASLIWSLHA